MKLFVRFLLAALLFACVPLFSGAQQTPATPPALAPAPAEPRPPSIEAMRQEMTQIETQVQRENLTDSELERLRARLAPILEGVRIMVERETPRLDEINARLEKIGPAPKDKEAPESAEVTRNRAEQEARKKEIDEVIRVARLVQVRAEQAQTAIADYRRRLFKRAILERSESIVSPWLWNDAIRALPEAVGDFIAFVQFRLRLTLQNLDQTKVLAALGLLALVLISYFPTRRMLLRVLDAGDEKEAAPDRGLRAFGALRYALLVTLPPLAMALVLTAALRVVGLSTDRLGEFIVVLLFALPALAALYGLLIGILRPKRPGWRVAHLEQSTVDQLFPALYSIVLLVFAGKMIEAANQSISAALPITVAAKGITALAAALILGRALRKIDQAQDLRDESLDEFGPAVAADSSQTFAITLKIIGWFWVVITAAAALTGYVALASFLSDQFVWLLGLGSFAYLLLITVDEYLINGASRDNSFTRQLRATTGIAPTSLRHFAVLASGVLRFLIYAVGILLALASFGVDSGDIIGSLRAAMFGFQVGGVTISFSNIAQSIALFAGLVIVFRSIQNWVEKTYLPSTTLDAGLQNSIATVIGYIGFVVAALLAANYLGFSLEKLAFVAGALSLGIGFGLQSIVSNFVSGLILLWERPIRVGDLIVVGGDTGRVRRINVRSTEIQTADRASLIVPNSEFITGRVKNMMHSNRVARVVIPLAVNVDADPETVRKLLLDAADNHQEVLSTPKADVIFLDVTSSSLNFELRCFTDIDSQVTVRSELMFAIYRALKSMGGTLTPPKVPATVEDVRGLLQDAEPTGKPGKPEKPEKPC